LWYKTNPAHLFNFTTRLAATKFARERISAHNNNNNINNNNDNNNNNNNNSNNNHNKTYLSYATFQDINHWKLNKGYVIRQLRYDLPNGLWRIHICIYQKNKHVFSLKCDIYYAFTFQPYKNLFKMQVTYICLN